MGRYLSTDAETGVAGGAPGLNQGSQPSPNNPVTGVYGSGLIRIYTKSGTFVVPTGCEKVRVRMWGAGGDAASNAYGSGGGGFTLKECTVTPGESITVTVSGSASFGTHCSASAGTATTAGTGSGGDLNYSGGAYPGSSVGGGGSAANVFGDGSTYGGSGSSGAGGFGRGTASGDTPKNGGNGLTGFGGIGRVDGVPPDPPTVIINTGIDYIGTGPGGAGGNDLRAGSGINGGGGGGSQYNNLAGDGGYPGGGSGGHGSKGGGAMLIVEW